MGRGGVGFAAAAQVQVTRAADEDGRQVFEVFDDEVVDDFEEFLVGDLDLETGQVHAEADMDAVAEGHGQVQVFAERIEDLRILVDLLVVIG